MKSKVTGISPAGATLTRANGEVVNVGDDVDDDEPATLTIPAPATGGAVRFAGKGGIISERRATRTLPTSPPTTQTVALDVSDTAQPARATPSRSVLDRIFPADAPPALKVQ